MPLTKDQRAKVEALALKLYDMQTLQETPHQKWSADKSVFQMRDGNLYLTMSGMTFPMGGGAQSGFWSETVNISKHIEDIVRRVLSEKP